MIVARPADGPRYIPLLIDPALRLRPLRDRDLAARAAVRAHRPAPLLRISSASIALVAAPQVDVDFSDPESQRVLDAMACAVARELGRQAARAWWEGGCQ